MSTINLSALTKPFPKSEIRQRKGRRGKMLDYVETHAVIARLNEAFDGEWSFRVTSHWKEDEEVGVLAMLSAGGQVKQQFGSSAITREREGCVPGMYVGDRGRGKVPGVNPLGGRREDAGGCGTRSSRMKNGSK